MLTFVVIKPPGLRVFHDTETIHNKKLNKSVVNTITFNLEDDNEIEVDFNGEMITFTI